MPACLARVVGPLAALLFAGAAAAITWEPVPTGGTFAVDVNSVGPSPRTPGATGVWVNFAPGLSVDCSPPRGCLAARQRLYYVFSCSPRYAVPDIRISYDLNDNVVRQETRDAMTPFAGVNDAGAVAVLNAFCPLAR